MTFCPECGHPWSVHADGKCTIQSSDNFNPTKSCECVEQQQELLPSEQDLERIAKIGGYVDALSALVSPFMEGATKAEDPGLELSCLSIALLTVAHISLHPFSPDDRADLDNAAATLFDQFYDQVVGEFH